MYRHQYRGWIGMQGNLERNDIQNMQMGVERGTHAIYLENKGIVFSICRVSIV